MREWSFPVSYPAVIASLKKKTASFRCRKLLILLAPQVRLELTTLRLTAECSAIELLRNIAASVKAANLKIRNFPRRCQVYGETLLLISYFVYNPFENGKS